MLSSRCRDVDVAEDLAQETLTRTWQRWEHVSALDQPEAWCHRVATNLSHSRWRRLHAESRAYARVGTAGGISAVADDHHVVDDRDELACLTRDLSERERRVLALRHVADLPVDQVSQVLGQPTGTVTSTASRATTRVRAALAAAALAASGLVGALLPPVPSETTPAIIDVTGGDATPTVLPDGFASCPTPQAEQVFCSGPDRISLRTGAHETFAERGTPLPVGPRTGYLQTRDDGRIELTVSDQTSSADLHYRVVADASVSAADLVRLVESIPAFARVTTGTARS